MPDVLEQFEHVRRQLAAELGKAAGPKAIEEVRVRFLGRKGLVTTLTKGTDFSQLAPDQRREFGTGSTS